jgi:nucleoside-diphosphate-sugar epimerase
MKKEEKHKAKDRIALVTGATSALGRRIVEELLKRKYEVRVVLRDNPSSNPEWKSLPSGARVYIADIGMSDEGSKNMLLGACKGVGVVFHIAAATSNASNRYNEMINTNVIGTENILRAFIDSNPGSDVLKFIYSSSITVYGYERKGEVLTEESDARPQSSYSESKYMAEQIIKAFGTANERLDYTILRMGIIYGKGYEHNFMRIFRLIKEGKLAYIGKGTNHLALINIEDAVRAFFLVLDSGKCHNEIYNLTDGVKYTQTGLFKEAAKMLGVEAPTKSVNPFLAGIAAKAKGINVDQFKFLISDRIVSIDKIKKELGFKPLVKMEVGGKQLANEFLKRHR